jgi:hypothetical protein
MTLTAASLLGCAERYRDADDGHNAQEVDQLFESLRNRTATQGVNALSQAVALKDDPTTDIYFAESYPTVAGVMAPMGPPAAVTPVDFPELGLNIGIDQIKNIQVFFLNEIDGNGRHNHALVMNIDDGSGSPPLFAAANTDGTGDDESYVDDDGVFHASFRLDSGVTLNVESDDTEDGELANVIQLRLYIDNGQEAPYFIGKISSLIGYLGH